MLREAKSGKRGATLLATGSEVGIAVKAADAAGGGRHRRGDRVGAVVRTVPPAAARAIARRCSARRRASAIEAGIKQGWQEWIRRKDAFVGLSDFGASAPAPQLYEHFGMTPAKVVEAAKRLLKG